MTAAVRAELLKLGRRPALRALGLAAVAILVLFRYGTRYGHYLAVTAGERRGAGASILEGLLPAEAARMVAAAASMEVAVAALVAGALVAGGEHQFGTLKTVRSQCASRWRIWAGQALGLAVLLGGLVVVLLGAALGVSAAIAAVEGASLAPPPASDLLWVLAAGWLTAAMWGSLGLTLATLLRSSDFAVGLGLVWMLGVEHTIRELRAQIDFLAGVYEALPGANALGLAHSLGTLPGRAEALAGPPPSGGHLPLVVAAYIVAFLAVALAVFRRRDLT